MDGVRAARVRFGALADLGRDARCSTASEGQLQFPAYAIVFKRTLPHDPSLRPSAHGLSGLRAPVLGLSLWLAISYAGIDWFLPKLWTDTLGHSLYTARDLRQIADLGGAFLITFLVVLANDTIFRLCYRWLERGEPSLRPALAASGPELATLALLAGGRHGSTGTRDASSF